MNLDRRLRWVPVRPGVGLVLLICLSGLACAEEEATPIDPLNPPTTTVDEQTGVTHYFEPNDQMKEAAAQQCLDDPSLEQGYIRAVDPSNSDIVVSEYEVDCAEVRDGES